MLATGLHRPGYITTKPDNWKFRLRLKGKHHKVQSCLPTRSDTGPSCVLTHNYFLVLHRYNLRNDPRSWPGAGGSLPPSLPSQIQTGSLPYKILTGCRNSLIVYQQPLLAPRHKLKKAVLKETPSYTCMWSRKGWLLASNLFASIRGTLKLRTLAVRELHVTLRGWWSHDLSSSLTETPLNTHWEGTLQVSIKQLSKVC